MQEQAQEEQPTQEPTQVLVKKNLYYKCDICGIKKHSKITFERHLDFCKYIHTGTYDRESVELVTPSTQVLVQYVLDLSEKIKQLEKTVDKLKKQSITKKSINEYLETIRPPKTLKQWIDECDIAEHDLETLYEKNMSQCITTVLFRKIEQSPTENPLRCFIQKPTMIFVYEKTEINPDGTWRSFDSEEFKKVVEVLKRRIECRYYQWKNEHRSEIETNEKLKEIHREYIMKLSGNSQLQREQQIVEIKKAVIQKIQVSLKYVE